mgnify:CR=1 FL=1
MALTYSQTIPSGAKAPDFSLLGIDGKNYSLADFKGKKALVIIFMCNHCPYVKACIDRLIALQNEFGTAGAQFVGINANDEKDYPEDGFENMKEFVAERKINFPYLRDETQETAKAYTAVCTPDIFVYDENLGLAYHGRIENNELAEALKALLAGEKPNKDQKPSMGCSIKWK